MFLSLWLYNIARGIDNEPVINRLLSKSVGACKKFPGKQAITSLDVASICVLYNINLKSRNFICNMYNYNEKQ